ncbi:MAG: hypothetical protein D6731_22895 [Planctomycetota bacterium]|nr:MAG: hypothetical protein D6731_22895 [Planctomycetota bacterium]
MIRTLRAIATVGCVAALLAAPACRTRHVPVEAEALAGLPLLPAGVLPSWDERPESDRTLSVPRTRDTASEPFGWLLLDSLSIFLPLCMPRWDRLEVEPGGWWEKRPLLYDPFAKPRKVDESRRSILHPR